MRDIPFWILKSLCDFMYAGEVHIFQDKLEELLSVAEALKIKGLAGKSSPPDNQDNKTNKNQDNNKKKQQNKPQQQSKSSYTPNNYESASVDYENEELLDPLDLLEPLYEEMAEEKQPNVKKDVKVQVYQPVKRNFPKKIRKRKISEPREEPVSRKWTMRNILTVHFIYLKQLFLT